MAVDTLVHAGDKKNKLTSGVITLLIHAGILVLMMWLGLKPPDPPWEEQGIMISLGEPDQGGPDQTPAAEQPETEPQPEEQIPVEEEENIATQDIEDAPVVKKTEDKKPSEVKKPSTEKKPEVKEPERKADSRAMFRGNRTNGDPNSQGTGDGDVPGNQGSPDGSENGSLDGRGQGTSGDGFGYSLSGRKIKRLPDVQDNSKATGKVVVTVTVDKNGRVVKAEPGARGTTTTDPGLWEKARQAALRTEFSTRADGATEQVGTMTFVFKYKP